MPRNFAKSLLLGFETKGFVQVRTDRRFERGIKAYLLRYLLTTTLTGLIRSGVLATYFFFISLAIQESPLYSRQRRYKAKRAKAKRKHHCLVFFFCRCCCYSCKQKSRHPIIPVGERERETGPSPASPLPSPPKKKRNRIWQGYHLSKAWIVVRAHHYSLQVLTVLHTRRCSVLPKLYPIPKLFSFSVSLSLFLSFCPALLPPIRNSTSQDPLRACVSCLACLVEFSPPGRTTTLFHSFLQ